MSQHTPNMQTKTTLKEQLVGLCQSQGFDFMSSCEMVTEFLDDMKRRGPGRYKFVIGNLSLTIEKGR